MKTLWRDRWFWFCLALATGHWLQGGEVQSAVFVAAAIVIHATDLLRRGDIPRGSHG